MKSHVMDYIRLNRAEFRLTFWLLTAIFVIVFTFTTAVLLLLKEPSAILLSGVLLPCILAFFFLAFAISDLVSGFDFCLSFGATRKETILSIGLCQLALTALSSVMIITFTAIEKAVFPPFWMKLTGLSQLRMEELLIPEGGLPPADTLYVPDFSLDWWWTPVILICALLVGDLIGACMRRFGRRAGTILYVLWIVLAITSGTWLSWVSDYLTILLPVLLVLVLSGLIWTVRYLLHASYHP